MVGLDGVDNGCDYRIVNYRFDDYRRIMVRVMVVRYLYCSILIYIRRMIYVCIVAFKSLASVLHYFESNRPVIFS